MVEIFTRDALDDKHNMTIHDSSDTQVYYAINKYIWFDIRAAIRDFICYDSYRYVENEIYDKADSVTYYSVCEYVELSLKIYK
jgi:hypothetical protein